MGYDITRIRLGIQAFTIWGLLPNLPHYVPLGQVGPQGQGSPPCGSVYPPPKWNLFH